jgi:hypothetical protein
MSTHWRGLARALLAGKRRAAAAVIVVVLAAAGGASGGAPAEIRSPDEPSVPWSHVKLQGQRLGSRITADVRVETLSAAGESARFLPSPFGEGFKATGPRVTKLSVTARIDLPARQPITLESYVWFDPLRGTPLYRIRTRFGLDDYYQMFRFTREGVFRRQLEPASQAEAARPPKSWTKTGEHFYAYPSGEQQCEPVSEPSIVIYKLLTAVMPPPPEGPTSACVFHKRQAHRMEIHPAGAQSIRFDYVEQRPEAETVHSGAMEARMLRLESEPIGSYRGEVEEFLENGARIYVSPDGRLPLMVGCDLPLVGRVELKLIQVGTRTGRSDS